MDFLQFQTQFQVKLDQQQKEAVQKVDGPVLLLAVPGSGKTTVLVTRIGYMLYVCGIPPESILTMTYTVAAAKDMRARFTSLFQDEYGTRLEFRTINGVCSRIIRTYEITMGRKAFDLMDDESTRNALLIQLCRALTGEYISESTIAAAAAGITYVKNQMLTGEEIKKVDVGSGIDFEKLYRSYCRVLRERRWMDYDDQMVYALRILQQYPEILHRIQRKYRYFCVDEAQDTSKIQHEIIRLLASGSKNIFMVGDEDQSIYGFRAAYPEALTRFDAIYPEASILYMEQNYRSTAEIVATADRFIQKNQNRHPKHMRAVGYRGNKVTEIRVRGRKEQYQYLARVAKNCTSETAVLYRDNDSALPVIDILDREGIPYRCRQINSAFFSHIIVRDITDFFCLALDPTDSERFLRIYYKLDARITKQAAQQVVKYAGRNRRSFFAYISDLPNLSQWTEQRCRELDRHMSKIRTDRAEVAIDRIVNAMGYKTYLRRRGMDTNRLDILRALSAKCVSIIELMDRMDELHDIVACGGSGDADCRFVLSTIHSSKGLEYDRVFLADVVDGVLPAVAADDEDVDTYEEERRLFYVGMTRAIRELNIFSFKDRDCSSAFSDEVFGRVKETKGKKQAASVQYPVKKRNLMSDDKIREAQSSYLPETRVIHKVFGSGVIIARNGDIVTICFDSGGIRRIMLSTALKVNQLYLE